MIGSTLPLAEGLDQHPVHRATTLLREALLNSTANPPDPAEVWDDGAFSLDPSPTELTHGPVSISFPPPFASLLGPSNEEVACQPPVTRGHDGNAADAPPEAAPEGDEMLDRAAEAQLQNLVQAFYRRQRQASLLVACSVVAAFALTFAGLVLLFSVSEAKPTDPESSAPRDDASASWTAPSELTPAVLRSIHVETNRAAKGAAFHLRTDNTASAQTADYVSGAKVILADTGDPLALGPLLALGSARYVLLRGLPEAATLSAGRNTGRGTWMVKGTDVPDLTVTVGDTADGDYPLEVYLLDTADGLQARHRLVLRVDRSPRIYAAGFGLGSFALQNSPQDPGTAEPQAAGSVEANNLRAEAQRLLSDGDVAAARGVLTRLAEDGNKDSAYELALTYDHEVLDKAGMEGVDGDRVTARAWYAHAARGGHVDAAERLKMLAKPRGGA